MADLSNEGQEYRPVTPKAKKVLEPANYSTPSLKDELNSLMNSIVEEIDPILLEKNTSGNNSGSPEAGTGTDPDSESTRPLDSGSPTSPPDPNPAIIVVDSLNDPGKQHKKLSPAPSPRRSPSPKHFSPRPSRSPSPSPSYSKRSGLEPKEVSAPGSRRNSWVEEVTPESIVEEDSRRRSYSKAMAADDEVENAPPPIVIGDGDNDAGVRTCGNMSTGAKIKCLSVIFIPILALVIAIMVDSFHVIEEGNVGIYYRQGALQDSYTMPGMRTKAPFLTTVIEVIVRPTTDKLDTITGVTKDGIANYFKDIQVITHVKPEYAVELVKRFGRKFKHTLVFDRISEELRLFCANHTIDQVYNEMFLDIAPLVKTRTELSIARLGNGSIEVLNLAIPKPDIPPDIARNYKRVKVQWTEQLVAVQKQKTEKIVKETQAMMAVADAEREKAVLEIEVEKDLLKKATDKNISMLDNTIHKNREETLARVDAFKKEKAAEANIELYSPIYVKYQTAKALSQNTKFYFSGEQSALGSLLQNLLGTA